MLTAVKSMQSFARLLAVSIGLGALRHMARSAGIEPDSVQQDPVVRQATQLVIDRVWRCVIGIALIPAALAIFSRLTIPETPRYYADIMKDLRRAVEKALKIYVDKRVEHEENLQDSGPVRQDSNWLGRWYAGMWSYLRTQPRALRNLLLITVLWGLMDAGFYGMALDNYNVLATLSVPHSPADGTSSFTNLTRAVNSACDDTLAWRGDSESPDITIYQMIQANSIRSLEIVSVASVAGSLTAIAIVHYFRRRIILVTTFLLVALLFAITGATLYTSAEDGKHHVHSTVFYAIMQFVYNVGPNTMIFVLAAEIFPTVYRGTFYGFAAAGGKVGAIIIRSSIERKGADLARQLSIRLLIFVPIMLLAACMSWYLPEVQKVPPKGGAETDVEKATSAKLDEISKQERIEGDQVAKDQTGVKASGGSLQADSSANSKAPAADRERSTPDKPALGERIALEE